MAENSFILFPLRDRVCVLSPWLHGLVIALVKSMAEVTSHGSETGLQKAMQLLPCLLERLTVGSLNHHVGARLP